MGCMALSLKRVAIPNFSTFEKLWSWKFIMCMYNIKGYIVLLSCGNWHMKHIEHTLLHVIISFPSFSSLLPHTLTPSHDIYSHSGACCLQWEEHLWCWDWSPWQQQWTVCMPQWRPLCVLLVTTNWPWRRWREQEASRWGQSSLVPSPPPQLSSLAVRIIQRMRYSYCKWRYVLRKS